MSAERVSEAFDRFAGALYGGVEELPPRQRAELRDAFHAGAHWLFEAVVAAIEDPSPDVVTGGELAAVDGLHRELEEWKKEKLARAR